MPDARVQAAVDNWGSRLIANGVDYNDFRRVTSSLERWEDWLDAWTRTADGHREQAEQARAAGNALSAGEAFLRAAVAYHFAKFVWVVDAERNRATTAKAIAAMAAAHALLDPTAERVEQPALIVTGALDRLIPWQDTRRIADEIPGAEWVLYDDGTHVCNNLPFRYRPLVGDWMADRLARVGQLAA